MLLCCLGIVRDSTCERNYDWNVYTCGGDEANPGPDYRMLMVESMDVDTETRRISPVALFGENDENERYVDLINGPQDHGWCLGYTCQKRLSTFPMLVSIGERDHCMKYERVLSEKC